MGERHRDRGGQERGFLAGYLASETGAWYLGLIRTAKSWGFKPSALINHHAGEAPPDEWDYLLAFTEALVASEQCAQCGRPKWICQNDDSDIDFRVFEEECSAMAAKARHEKRNEGKEKPGIAIGMEHYTHSRTPMEQFRRPWLDAQGKKADTRLAERRILPRDAPPGVDSATLDSAPVTREVDDE